MSIYEHLLEAFVTKSCVLAHMVSVNCYSSTGILFQIQSDGPSLNLNWQQHPDGDPSQSRGRAKNDFSTSGTLLVYSLLEFGL